MGDSESVLPAQRRVDIDRSSPEYRLMYAILEDAVRVLRNRSDTKLSREALAWVNSNDTLSLFSFLNICEAFELEHLTVRASLNQRRFHHYSERRIMVGRRTRMTGKNI